MDDLSYLEGLMVSEFGDYGLIWCEDLGYVMGFFGTRLARPRKGEWCRVWYEEGSIRPTGLQPPTIIGRNAVGIIVERCEKSRVTPCPTFLHRESREPCVTVFAHKMATQEDSSFVQLFSLVLKIPDKLRENVNNSSCGQFVATLQFTDSDTMAPIIVDAVPFAQRKGYMSRIDQDSNTCQISVGFDYYDVEPHVFKFAQCYSEDIFEVRQKISVIMSKEPGAAKPRILRLYTEKRSTVETDSTLSVATARLSNRTTMSPSAVSVAIDSYMPTGSNILDSSMNRKRRHVTFDSDSPKIVPYIDYDSTPYSARNFIVSEPRLRKPIDLLKKKAVKSIMKKSLVAPDQDCHVSGGEHANSDCGCSSSWLHYAKHDPHPKVVQLELTVPIFLISRHTHSIGKPDEHQVWRAVTQGSFQGFIEFLPSEFTSPIILKMGNWIKVVSQKIIDHELNYHGFIVKRGTTWQKYFDFDTPKFRIVNSKFHEHVQVYVELIRSAVSGEYMNTAHFGSIWIPSELLGKYLPYPENTHSQAFSGWIEPLSETRRVEDEIICWKALKIVYCNSESAEDHLASLVKTIRVTQEVSYSADYENKQREKKLARKEAKRMKRLMAAKKSGQNYIPKGVRLDKIGDFLHYLASPGRFPEFVAEDVVTPCTYILNSNDKSKNKLGPLTKIIAQELVVSEPGKKLYKQHDGTDHYIKSLVQILNENSTYVNFDAEDDNFGKSYRGFVSYYDVSDSSSDSGD